MGVPCNTEGICKKCGEKTILKARQLCCMCYEDDLKKRKIQSKERCTYVAKIGPKYRERYTENEINEICDDLIDWAKNSNEIHLAGFTYTRFRKSRSYLYDVGVHYPKVKEALAQAKEILGMKMTNACYNSAVSGVNATFGEKYLPVYDKDYKDLLEWKAKISREQPREDQNKCIFNEIIGKIKNSAES